MKYFNNRFDFLRIYSNGAFSGQYADDDDMLQANIDYLLPSGENVVTGSTCYYVDKGDLFIYYKTQDSEDGNWINQTTFESYIEGENPYYSSEEEPDDDDGGVG